MRSVPLRKRPTSRSPTSAASLPGRARSFCGTATRLHSHIVRTAISDQGVWRRSALPTGIGTLSFGSGEETLKLEVCGDEMAHLGCALQMKSQHIVLNQTIGIRDPFMLAKMFHPRTDQECLDDAALISGILEHPPAERAISKAFPPQRFD